MRTRCSRTPVRRSQWTGVLTVARGAGLLTAWAVLRLPGAGGHVPFQGLKAGGTQPSALPGVLLAALASLGLGLVLGPEAPLIALGSGVAGFAVTRARKDTPDQMLSVIAAQRAFAALATIFGSPVVGAVILIAAAGLGGPMLPPVLLPGTDVGRDRFPHLHRIRVRALAHPGLSARFRCGARLRDVIALGRPDPCAAWMSGGADGMVHPPRVSRRGSVRASMIFNQN